MVKEYTGVERRRFKRVKISLVVFYSLRGAWGLSVTIGGVETNALMLDLGDDGISFVAREDIAVDTVLAIKFTLITKSVVRKMELEGVVMNRHALKKGEYRLGIQFTKISKENRATIGNFVLREFNS